MENKCVGDIMIPLDQYPHIPYWFTLRQAMAEMERSQIEVDGRKSLPRAVLVFDESYKLLGFVRRRDIMRALEPRFLISDSLKSRREMIDMKVDPNIFELSYETMVKAIRDQAERKVGEVMQPISMTIDHDDHLMKAVFELVDSDLSFLPVLKDKRVVGVLRTVAVFKELAKIVL